MSKSSVRRGSAMRHSWYEATDEQNKLKAKKRNIKASLESKQEADKRKDKLGAISSNFNQINN